MRLYNKYKEKRIEGFLSKCYSLFAGIVEEDSLSDLRKDLTLEKVPYDDLPTVVLHNLKVDQKLSRLNYILSDGQEKIKARIEPCVYNLAGEAAATMDNGERMAVDKLQEGDLIKEIFCHYFPEDSLRKKHEIVIIKIKT